MLGWLLACAAEGGDSTEPELPVDTEVVDTAPDTFEVDTSVDDTATNLDPEHVLTITHDGEWAMSPVGGPYTAMTGSLLVEEVLDGDVERPTCAATFALTGESAEEPCAGCTATFRVRFYLSEGATEACQDPDLPAVDESWDMGWNPSTGTIQLNVGGSGVWVDWYAAERLGDDLTFSWSTTVGVAVEDDE